MGKKLDENWEVIVELLTYLKHLKAMFKVEIGEGFYKVLIVQNNKKYVSGDVLLKIISLLKGRCKRFAFLGKEEGIEVFIAF